MKRQPLGAKVAGSSVGGQFAAAPHSSPVSPVSAFTAAQAFVGVYEHMLDTSEAFHEALSFDEAKSLADVLFAGGNPNYAAILILQWQNVQDEEYAAEHRADADSALGAYREHPGYDSDFEARWEAGTLHPPG